MPPKSKGASSNNRTSKSLFKSTNSTTKKPRSSIPPLPFSLPSPSLLPLLSQLSEKHIYIPSLDASPRPFKRKIFLVPVLTNLAIIALLAWRIYTILPHYISLASSFSSISSSLTLSLILRRFLSFSLDYLLYALLLPWPREFFLGTKSGSPVLWRSAIGLRDIEIVIRRSRAWDVEVLVPGIDVVEPDSAPRRRFEEEVQKATSVAAMHEKTGYMLLNSAWDLDWRAMVVAQQMVDAGDAALADFRTKALVHSRAFGWVLWDEGAAGGGREEEGRRRIVQFKDVLTSMGKEGLFFRWIELVQFESAKEGGFTPERQVKTMRRVKEMFEGEGVDFEKFWESVGGMEGMPGLDLR
jgi:hypothetical protein